MRALLLSLLLLVGCDACCFAQDPIPAEDTSVWCCDGCRDRFEALTNRVCELERLQFNGVGNAPAPRCTPLQPQRAVVAGYPLRKPYWTGCDTWKHLNSGQHRGKFDPAWLQSLSWDQLQSLHADDHEGKVNWNYAKRPAAAKAPQVIMVPGNCPGGVCPRVIRR